MKKRTRRVCTCLLSLMLAVSAGMLAVQWHQGRQSAAALEAAQALAAQSTAQQPSRPAATAPPVQPVWQPAAVEEDDPYLETLAALDLAALQQVNPEVVGWLLIPGTGVDQPVVQAADNEYYLEHSWDLTPNRHGAVFLECRNTADFADFNTILYGHNMRDGSMFAALHDYADPDFFAEHPYIYLRTGAGVFRYTVFASYDAAVESPTYGLSFRQQTTRQTFLQHAQSSTLVQSGLQPAATDRILTLSTCTGVGYASRRVVQAYLPMVELTAP